MGALLDTHVRLWYLLGDTRLSIRQREIIEDNETELWLSPIRIWEALLLIERKRIATAVAPSTWLEDALRSLPAREAKMTFQQIDLYRQPRWRQT